jgi:hypothetical protein
MNILGFVKSASSRSSDDEFHNNVLTLLIVTLLVAVIDRLFLNRHLYEDISCKNGDSIFTNSTLQP